MKTFILATALLSLLTSVTAQTETRYIGCYRGSGNLSPQQNPSGSPAECRETCTGAGNFTVEAITRGIECYCGNAPPPGAAAPDSMCGIECPGNPDARCGSIDGAFFAVYSTGVSTSPPAGPNNSTVASGGRNSTTRSGGAQTSVPANTTRGGATASTGSAAPKTDGPGGTTGPSATGTAASTSTGSSSGDSVQVGSGVLLGAVIGILAMVF